MTKTIYYLHIKGSIVIAYNSHESDSESLPRGEKFIKVETNNPNDYLGLNEKQILMNPLPVVSPYEGENTLNVARVELKKLYLEIQFTKFIGEDIKELETSFNKKLDEYNELKG